MLKAEILSQGDEVVSGQIADTNGAWLANELVQLGFEVTRHTTVGDKLDDITQLVSQAAQRCDVAISTGGLGPTDDDLTALAVSRAFNRPLVLDPVALEQVKSYYVKAARQMPKSNEKQAYLPTGSTRLDNYWGTAPAFTVQEAGAWLAFLPGVPREMKEIFRAYIPEFLAQRHELRVARLVTIRTTGVGESTLQDRIGSPKLENAIISYRTKLPENHVKLRFSSDASEAYIRAVTEEIVAKIGSPVFGVEGLDEPGGSLIEVVARALCARGETLSTAESCTGGRVAAMCTSVAGSSQWFIEGVVAYSNRTKVELVGVDPEAIAQHGAVSEELARQLAEGVRRRARTTFGLSTTGIAGPGGGTKDKAVGTVHIALATPTKTYHRCLRLSGQRERIQQLSAAAVIDLLRRYLQEHL
jgi:nicotinamide-nucleotide amidase